MSLYKTYQHTCFRHIQEVYIYIYTYIYVYIHTYIYIYISIYIWWYIFLWHFHKYMLRRSRSFSLISDGRQRDFFFISLKVAFCDKLLLNKLDIVSSEEAIHCKVWRAANKWWLGHDNYKGFFGGGWKGRGCSWGTLRIPAGKIGEPWGRLGEPPPPPLRILLDKDWWFHFVSNLFRWSSMILACTVDWLLIDGCWIGKGTYCWWLKSQTTTWDGAETLYIMGFQLPTSTGEFTGFQPSTVRHCFWTNNFKIPSDEERLERRR